MKSIIFLGKWIIMLMVLVLSIRVTADEEPISRYRLRIPPVNDYLAAIPDLLNGVSGLDSPSLVHAITTEWQLFYQDSQVDYDLAISAFDAITDYVDAMREWEAYVYPIIQSLLDHHKIELKPANPTLLRYGDWEIKAIPRDFSGDGQPEWILQVAFQDDLYQQWYAVRLDDGQPVLITIPLPFYSSFASYWSANSRSIRELIFHDLTGDRIPEWVIAIGSIGGDNHGYLAVLQWQDGHFIDLAAGKDEDNPDLRQMSFVMGSGGPETPMSPAGIGIMFADVDNNDTVEVILRDYMVFTWIPEIGRYRLSQELRVGSIDPFYVAQQAFQKKQYKRAIQFYEQSINSDAEGDGTVFSDLTTPYTALRLALLYSLQGDSVKAENIIERAVLPPALKTGFPPISDLIPTVAAAYRERQSALDLCTAMYNVFDDYFKHFFNYDPYMDTDWGETAITAGCDAPAMIADLLTTPFDTRSSPAEQVEARGIQTVASVHTDLNNDGVDEWLIWLKAHVNPIFFLSDSSTFIVSRPYMDYPDPDKTLSEQFVSFTLPDNAGQVWVWLPFRDDLPDTPSNYFEPSYDCTTRSGEQVHYEKLSAYMNIYQVRDNQLSSMQSILVCEPLTFDQVFLDGQSSRQLQGWDTLEFGSDWITKVIATPTIYDWDSITQSYLPRPVTPAIPFSQEELFGYQPPQPAVDTSYWNLRGLFKAKQYDEILSMLNLAIETFDPEISCQTWEELLYNRAMILEVLNHPDEALQDYIAVYEYPDPSPWRDLAELHLEITEP